MNLKINLFYFFAILLSISFFTSCYDDNLDDLETMIEEVDVDIETIDCDSFLVNLIVDDSTGMVSAETSGGREPFLFEWSNGETTQSIITNSNEFSVTVTDSNECIVSTSGNFGSNDPCLGFTAELIEYPDSSGNEITTLSAIVNGGTPPYGYNWSNGETSADITVQTSSNYSVTIEDAMGCVYTLSDTIIVILITCEDLTVEIEEYPDSNSNDVVTLSAIVNDGTPPYAYEWSNGQQSQEIMVQTSGEYSVTVEDINGCEATISYTVIINSNDPCSGLSTEIIAFPDSTGLTILSTNTTGGTAPYFYEWSNNEIGEQTTVPSSGEHSVTVTDAIGCSVSESIEL